MKYSKVVYRTATGEITGVFTASGPFPSQAREGESEIEDYVDPVDNRYVHYVVNQKLAARPKMPVTRTGLVLRVPVNTKFKLRGLSGEVEGTTSDGVLEFDLTEAGRHELQLECFPYLPEEMVLEGSG
jgi:hypothetical protein